MIKILRNNSSLIVLFLYGVILSVVNYVPGTYLSGWDTLHPEFDFKEYFSRVFSIWQQHQGLGAVASQAHASELPRLIFYYISSLVLPDSFLRYFYFFLCLIFGPIGTYFFVKEIVKTNLEERYRESIAFICGLFYLLNLTTLQHFFVPLEMFATHFATLPFLFLFATKYLLTLKRSQLIFFCLTTILATPMAHTPTLFYSFFVVFAGYLLILGFLIKENRIKSSFLVLGLTLLLNAYWFLPNIYFVKNYAESVANSKIHYQFSDRAFQIGTNFGNFVDTAQLKNFLFDWGEFDEKKGRFVFLLGDWDKHIASIPSVTIALLIFIGVMWGIFISSIKKRIIGLSFLPVFLIPYFFINNDNFIFNLFSQFIENYFPILKESLRFPYTKFSALLLFSYCIYLAFFLSWIIPIIVKKYKKLENNLPIIISGFFILMLTFYMFPAFFGKLISPTMKVKIPEEYFEMFDYFKTKDSSYRIAPFPVHSFWGWNYYDWGYEGAGFLWFGLRQPLLDREFDRWMPVNENYYWEVSYAVYSQNLPLLEKVLEKYQVRYLLEDRNILDASSVKAPYLDQFEKLIGNSEKITLVKNFGEIKVYEFDNQVEFKNSVAILKDLPKVGPLYQRNNFDSGFIENSFYISDTNGNFDTYYPFRSLFSNRSPNQEEVAIEEDDKFFIFKKTLPKNINELKLIQPSTEGINWFGASQLSEVGVSQPLVSLNQNFLEVKIPKIKSNFSTEINPGDEAFPKDKNCDYLTGEKYSGIRNIRNERVVEGDKKYLRLESVLSNNCTAEFLTNNLPNDYSYLISIEAKNISGKSLLFWLENLNARKIDIETYLPKNQKLQTFRFIQPPMEKYGQGYLLHFDNWSFNRIKSVNELGKITIYPIPFDFLTSLKFVKENIPASSAVNCVSSVNKKSAFYYQVNLDNNCDLENSSLVFSQSFDGGWSAFRLGGGISQINQHILINNWSNGWMLNPSDKGKTIIIFYVPQMLQFVGYLLAISAIFVVFSKRFKNI